MQKINLLPSEIYNKISAGEVVENPASIVKELVENAIDAGSNNIVVDIVNGGITSVIVSDNGHGISKDYIKTAFLPHATSKIATSKDLENIATLGFRGEALPSIAAVSSVEIKTKAIDEFVGVKYTIKGGVSGEVSEIDCNNGTTIEVRNLFFNTPARQKFLKKPKSEEHEITAIIQGLILANPNIAIKYVADGKVIFNSNGKGLENALYAIYPNSITKHMVYLESEKYDIKVQGYIGLPTLTKPNRNYQTTIVNGRLISNSTISTAVSQAYGNMLMKRCFPVFCLEIIMPFDMLDVNVTPSKTDVRFSDSRSVFSSVYHACQDALHKNANFFAVHNEEENLIQNEEKNENYSKNSINLEQKYKNNSKIEEFSEQKSELNEIIDKIANYNKTEKTENIVSNKSVQTSKNISFSNAENTKLNDDSNNVLADIAINRQDISNNINSENKNDIRVEQNKICNDNISNSNKQSNDLLNKFSNITTDKKFSMPDNSAILRAGDTNGISFNFKPQVVKSNLFDEIEEEFSVSHKIIGQIFNCYLIVVKGENAYLIDQHAVHERLIYDKLMAQIESKNIASQPMLTPQIIQLAPQDSIVIENLLEDIRKIGFDIEEFGDFTFKINSIPIIFNNFNGNKFINCLLEEKYTLKNIDVKEILHNELAKKACKSAIKAGQKLNDIEIEELIKKIEQNKPIQCPHGRPTIIKFSRKDIDKLFKRII